MKILVQRDGEAPKELEEGFASELELQTFLREHADLMPLEEIDLQAPPLLCIGWEVGLASGAEDILYVDPNGLLTIVETKLRRNPQSRREVVGQILEYGAHMSTWTPTNVEQQAKRFFSSPEAPSLYQGCTLQEAFVRFQDNNESVPEVTYEAFIDLLKSNIEQGHFRLVIAVDEPPEPLLKTVEFVNRFSERFEMYLIQLKRFRDVAQAQNIFVPALFGKVATRPPRQPWNWDRYVRDLKWTLQDVAEVRALSDRLMSVAHGWQPELRLNGGWTTIYCGGRAVFGVQKFKRHGIDLWFRLDTRPNVSLPPGVTSRMQKSYFFVGGGLDLVSDDQLLGLCKASLQTVGVQTV